MKVLGETLRVVSDMNSPLTIDKIGKIISKF